MCTSGTKYPAGMIHQHELKMAHATWRTLLRKTRCMPNMSVKVGPGCTRTTLVSPPHVLERMYEYEYSYEVVLRYCMKFMSVWKSCVNPVIRYVLGSRGFNRTVRRRSPPRAGSSRHMMLGQYFSTDVMVMILPHRLRRIMPVHSTSTRAVY